MSNGFLNAKDLEVAKILDGFIPDRVFDAHMHMSDVPFGGDERFGFSEYYRDNAPYFGKREVRCMALTAPTALQKSEDGYIKSVKYMSSELDAYPKNLGSLLVKPTQSAEDIEALLTHERLRALKCYHIYAEREKTFDADIHEYLTESALAVADKHSLAVTLHMVKDTSLSDPENMRKIKKISRAFPNMKLVLAHAARSFAAWTAIESVEELLPYENIFFDFSGVCESPAMTLILKSFGVTRCMWGSDYNVSKILGKAISLGDTFHWIEKSYVENLPAAVRQACRHVGTENLLAVREAARLAELKPYEIEELFCGTALKVFE